MMRAILFLGSMFLMASGQDAGCELDSSDAVTNGINSALFIWAAHKRCHGVLLAQAPVKCEQDVASAIQSITAMTGSIADMVGSCGGFNAAHKKCGHAVNALVSATAGLAAAGGLIANKCADIVPAALDGDVLGTTTLLGKCTADAGSSVNSLFQASNIIRSSKAACANGYDLASKTKPCTASTFDVIGVLSNLGAFIAASVSDCTAYHAKETKTAAPDTSAADCSNAVLAGIGQLSTIAGMGLHIEQDCAVNPARLYLESTNNEAPAFNPSILALAAILPITAVLSFVAGSRFAKSRQQSSARSAELLESQEDVE